MFAHQALYKKGETRKGKERRAVLSSSCRGRNGARAFKGELCWEGEGGWRSGFSPQNVYVSKFRRGDGT